MAEKCSTRRAKLQRIMDLVIQMQQLNEAASQIETTLVAQGLADVEVRGTMNDVLGAVSSPTDTGGIIDECTGDTLADRLVNVLNESVTGGISWGALLETD